MKDLAGSVVKSDAVGFVFLISWEGSWEGEAPAEPALILSAAQRELRPPRFTETAHNVTP